MNVITLIITSRSVSNDNQIGNKPTFMVFLFTAKDIGSDKPEYKPKDNSFVYEFVHTIK